MPTWPEDKTAMMTAFHTWVQSDLDTLTAPGTWSVIWAEQNAPRPSKPYATLNFLDEPQAEACSSEILSCPMPPVAQNDIRTPASMILEVQLFAADDQSAVRAYLRQGIEAEYPHREDLAAAGLAVGEVVADRELTQVFSGAYEYRGSIELRLRVTLERTINNYPWIETANPAVIGVT